jgi:hypothetical protein
VPTNPESHRRRDFVRALVFGAPATSLALRDAAGNEEPKKDAAPPRIEADARMELVLARFGTQLDADARASVRAEVESIVRRAEMLRKFPLGNGDGPFPVFTPYRAPLVP